MRQILLVEDDADIQEAMVDLLREEGFAVRAASHGAEALQLLATPAYTPDVILLDLMMPVMDGHEFRRRQLAHPQWAAIPVVVVSADRNAWEKSQQMHANAFLPKPIDLETLLGTLEQLAP